MLDICAIENDNVLNALQVSKIVFFLKPLSQDWERKRKKKLGKLNIRVRSGDGKQLIIDFTV
jgi:hypothetical protein